MDLNLRPYRLQRIDEFTYGFTTDKDIGYRCSFLSYAEYFPNHPDIATAFYSFNLDLQGKPTKLPRGTDKRIADTVISIVGRFLESRVNAVVYVCDNSDGKEAVRAKKFLSWFNYFEHPSGKIVQVSNNFKAGGMLIYSSLLVHRNNKQFKKIVLAYLDLTRSDDK
jgi:hypothetical protein